MVVAPEYESYTEVVMMDCHAVNSSAFDLERMTQLFAVAEQCKKTLKNARLAALLSGKTVATVFFENSTRTRVSFELAAKRLGAVHVHLSADGSSIKKGETLEDTLETMLSLGCDALVMRHPESGSAMRAAQYVGERASVLNGGDGVNDHPSQGLLDSMTLYRHFGGDLANKKITIVGDALHSRVIRSNLQLLNQWSMDVHVCGPKLLVPDEFAKLGCTVHHDLAPALKGVDAVMALRIQHERQEAGLIESLEMYHRNYGLTTERLSQYAKPNVPVLHPGPMNRGVEISDELADGPQSLIRHQVTNGLLIRQALFIQCLIPEKIPEILSW